MAPFMVGPGAAHRPISTAASGFFATILRMASAYPGALDNLATTKSNNTGQSTDHAGHHNDLADAVNKIEAELGVTPSGAEATVAARFTAIEGLLGTGSSPRIVAGGNLGATYGLDVDSDPEVWLVGTLTANLTLTLTELVAGSTVVLLLAQDATGGRTLTIAYGAESTTVEVPSAPASVVGIVARYDGTDLFLSGMQGPPGTDGVDGVDGADAPQPVRCILRKTTTQSIANATHTNITWDEEVLDEGGWHDNVTNNHLVTVSSAGHYRIAVNLGYDNADGRRTIRLVLNNTVALAQQGYTGALESGSSLYWEGSLAVNDALHVAVYQASTATRTLQGPGTAFSPRAQFSVIKEF